jgi:hypothetical protein
MASTETRQMSAPTDDDDDWEYEYSTTETEAWMIE